MSDTTQEATPLPEDRGHGDEHVRPLASGERQERFLSMYKQMSMKRACKASEVMQEMVETWLYEDAAFADAFERVNKLKALRIRQKFIDSFDEISETIIRQAKGDLKHKASMAAAKLALDIAGLGKKSARRTSKAEAMEDDDEDAQRVAREMGWLKG